MSGRWYCQACGHHHGHENCTAIADDGGARKCGCTDHKKAGDQ